MSAPELSFSQPLSWALIGNLPFSTDELEAAGTPQPVGFSGAEQWPAEGEKVLKKWLKKQWDLPVIVVILTSDHIEVQKEVLRYFRHDLKNLSTRLICFAADEIWKMLLTELSQFRIHHLQHLSDLQPDFLNCLVQQEWQEYAAGEQLRNRRNHELELLTFIARMNREADFTTAGMSELAELLQGLVQAQVLLHVTGDEELHSIYPEPLAISQQWRDIAQQAVHSEIPEYRPLLLNLEKSDSLHTSASVLTVNPVCASLIFPLRCYEQINTWLVAFLDDSAISQLDVSRLSLLEKTVEQVRTQLERQLSETRLKAQYQRLQNTLSKLHQTQEQLYHSEKLSAVGQLAAGIAHEINNPVSFIMSNFEPLDEYIQTMSHMLKLHEEFTHAMVQGDEAIGNQLRQQISKEREAADLEFMLEDIYALVKDSRNGLKRVNDIVTNLRTFARRDNLESSDMDLCESVNSALNMMKYQLNNGINIQLNLPEKAIIEGNSGLLGQVIVNLIQNALHAMDGKGTLSIRLLLQDLNWLLEVEDSGSGIPVEIQSKIFDPFFTTKEIGKGTGLGLSTVYSIIQRHKGNISVDSEPGKTCFRITLPVQTV